MSGECSDCGNVQCLCLTPEEERYHERKALFQKVALNCVRYCEQHGEFIFYQATTESICNEILKASEDFATKGDK